MSVAGKLVIFFLLNIGALFFLIYRLVNSGNQFTKALRLVWSAIVGNPKEIVDNNVLDTLAWVPVLRKTWWLMCAFYLTAWLLVPDLFSSLGLLLLVLIHVLWYLFATGLESKYERILPLNSQWGIIFKEMDDGTRLDQKTLAELDLRKKNLLVLAVQRNGHLIPFPKGLETVGAGDRLVMFGDLVSYHTVFEGLPENLT